MNAQAKKEETQKDASLFNQFQFRTSQAEKDFSKFKTGTAEAERLELAGVRRIMIELEGKPEMKEFCRRYSNLVDSIADILKNDLKIKPHEEERFINEVWGTIYGNLKIKFGGGYSADFLSQSLETKEFDCDNSAFLVFDVAKTVGVNAKMVSASYHVLVATDNFYFETADDKTTGGRYGPIDKLQSKHLVYSMTSDVEKIQSMSYGNRAEKHRLQGEYKEAIADFTKAIELDPKDADFYRYRGVAHRDAFHVFHAVKDKITADSMDMRIALGYLREWLEKKIHS